MGERNGETFVRRMHPKKMREQERGEKGSVKASATNKAKSGLARGFTLAPFFSSFSPGQEFVLS